MDVQTKRDILNVIYFPSMWYIGYVNLYRALQTRTERQTSTGRHRRTVGHSIMNRLSVNDELMLLPLLPCLPPPYRQLPSADQ